ncbi:transposable element Tc1 transposase [Trichonephila clavipes]|uniref:Transposable element Tc1 transposase n=1 Tax=Trichonephila clavipes TaxID=2585209 RepID=A0A8X6S4T3_TRICX|nr:transposable element Tc1 transposase [Trichonephila clavipes]
MIRAARRKHLKIPKKGKLVKNNEEKKIRRVICTSRSPLRQIIDGCVFNGLISAKTWHADWFQVVFSDESCFNLWDHDVRIRVRRPAGVCCLPECVIERHSDLTSGVVVWGVISYYRRSNFLRIKGNLNSNRIMHAHMLERLFKTSVQPNMQLLPWPAYSPVYHLLSTWGIWLALYLARDPHPAASEVSNFC